MTRAHTCHQTERKKSEKLSFSVPLKLPLFQPPSLHPSINATPLLSCFVMLTGCNIFPLLLDIDSSDLNLPTHDTNYW